MAFILSEDTEVNIDYLSQMLPTLRDHGLFLPQVQFINCFKHFLLLFQAGGKINFALPHVIKPQISMS